MKVLSSLLLALVCAAVSVAEPVRRPSSSAAAPQKKPAENPDAEAAPYPPSGWKPARPQSQYGPPNPAVPTTTETPETTTTQDETSPAPARLQQAPVSGVYYILLEDGRLQQVAFTAETDAVAQQPQQQIAQRPQRLQVQTFQLQVPARVQSPAPVQAPAAIQPRRPARIQLELQDVEPIRGPVYAYSGPLQRILRQA